MALSRGIITLTTAPAGSGKSYRRGPHWLLTEFLPQRSGIHWSNLPLHVDLIAEEAARRTGKTPEEFRERIKLIPAHVQDAWRSGESGPWDFFESIPLDEAHIALDEFHEFCGLNKPEALRQKYQFWFGQIRHRGATIEVISQAPEKIAREIHYEAAVKLSLVNSEDRRDPWCRILFGDWYELRAAFLTGDYKSAVWEIEYRRNNGRWVQEDQRVFWFDKFYFKFYDSYSKPSDAALAGAPKKREFQKRSKWGLIRWFIRRNWLRLSWRMVIAGGVLWFVFGGCTWMMRTVITAMNYGVQRSLQAAVPASRPADRTASTMPNHGRGGTPAMADDPSTQQINAAPSAPGPPPIHGSVDVAATIPADVKELEALRARVKALEEEEARYGDLVGVTADSAIFADGQVIHTGEKIVAGPHAGRIVKFVQVDRRRVVFDDGTILPLGAGKNTVSNTPGGILGFLHVDKQSGHGQGIPSAGIPKALSGAAGTDSGQSGIPASGGDSHPVGVGNAPGPMLTPTLGPSGGGRGLSGGPGQPAGDR